MLSEKQIFEQFSSVGIAGSYGELYLDKANSLDFVESCERNELAIIGIEGFIRDGDSFVPQLDLIADYSTVENASWRSHRHHCNNSARIFVERSNSRVSIYFSFAVISQQDFLKMTLNG